MQPESNTGGTPDPAKREVHPAAELFPLLEGKEFEELVEDIRANGLRTPILLDAEGRVLDGRNRLRACQAAGVEPRFETWDGRGSPLEVVVSLNLRRRHLNESQRALLAAQIKEKLEAEGCANWQKTEAAEKAALLMNISPRSVHRAVRILHSGDQRLILLVQSGELAVSSAAEKLQEQAAPEPASTAAAEGSTRFPILHATPRWERQKVEKLAALAVSEAAAEDAVLFLHAPDHALADAMELIEQWGFRYEASLVLGRRARAGRYITSQHDLALIATRGHPPAPACAPGSLAAGPPELEPIIEKMYPGLPRADALAARRRRHAPRIEKLRIGGEVRRRGWPAKSSRPAEILGYSSAESVTVRQASGAAESGCTILGKMRFRVIIEYDAVAGSYSGVCPERSLAAS